MTRGSDYIDNFGRRWLNHGQVNIVEAETERREEVPNRLPDPNHRPSFEEMADRFRLVNVIDNELYMLAEPDYLLAQQILDLEARGGPPPTPGNLGVRIEQATAPGLGTRGVFNGTTPSYSGGPGDGRIWTNPADFYQGAWPEQAFAALLKPSGITTCSATMIGRSLAVTAAHCLFKKGNNGTFQGYIASGGIRLGAQTANSYTPGMVYQFGSATIAISQVKAPVAWTHWGESAGDIAFIDFSTTSPNLGNGSGWMGTFWGMAGTDLYMYGYPGDRPESSQWWVGPGSYSHAISPYEYLHYFDAAPGSSGSCIARWTTGLSSYPNYGWAACSSFYTYTATNGGVPNYNVSRQWDSSTYSWAVSASNGTWP